MSSADLVNFSGLVSFLALMFLFLIFSFSYIWVPNLYYSVRNFFLWRAYNFLSWCLLRGFWINQGNF